MLEQAEACEQMGAPLNGVILRGAAADYAGRGPTYALMKHEAQARVGTAPALRLAGALHRMVLERRAPELATYYPSVGGSSAISGAWDAARALIEQQPDALRERIALPIQTNEVGRAVALLSGLMHISRAVGQQPIRLLEVGASAGLTLRFDAFGYTSAGREWGDLTGPVQLRDPWSGSEPDLGARVSIVERRGCDPHPIDPLSTAGRLALTSYVWPDQAARFERLRGAIELASRIPVTVDQASAADWVDQQLGTSTSTVTVVWHSVVMQYLTRDERERLDTVLAVKGRPAPVWRLAYEPAHEAVNGMYFKLSATEYRADGTNSTTTIGHGGGHGPPFYLA